MQVLLRVFFVFNFFIFLNFSFFKPVSALEIDLNTIHQDYCARVSKLPKPSKEEEDEYLQLETCRLSSTEEMHDEKRNDDLIIQKALNIFDHALQKENFDILRGAVGLFLSKPSNSTAAFYLAFLHETGMVRSNIPSATIFYYNLSLSSSREIPALLGMYRSLIEEHQDVKAKPYLEEAFKMDPAQTLFTLGIHLEELFDEDPSKSGPFCQKAQQISSASAREVAIKLKDLEKSRKKSTTDVKRK